MASNPALQRELDLHDRDIAATGVLCPVIREEIVAPCRLVACSYHTDLDNCHNCALVYAHQHGDEGFGLVDVAILYRKPVSVMQETVERILTKLRTEMYGDKEVLFEFVPLDGVCTCCESPIDEEPVRVHDLDYCSSRCAQKLPPESARLSYLPSTPLNR